MRAQAVKLTRQVVATAIGVALVALGLSDVAFVLLTRTPWLPHVGSEVVTIGLGVGLLWWSRRSSAGGNEPVAAIPDRTTPVLAVTFGSVLLLLGAFLGLLFSLFFGAVRGIEVFLVPWGVVGSAAVGAGGYRLVSIARSERATDRALMSIARTAKASAPSATRGPAASTGGPQLLDLHREAVDAVRGAYETSLPNLRFGAWFAVLLLPAVGAFFLWTLVSGVALRVPPFAPTVDAVLTVAAVVIAFLVWSQSVARLRALDLAEVELRAGRAPAEWSVVGRIPLRVLGEALRHPLSNLPSPSTDSEESLLASSLTLLRFGRRLAARSRRFHVAIFLFIFFIGSATALLSALLLLLHFYGPSAPVPVLIAGEWGPVLAVMAAAVVYLRRQLGSVDEVSRRLARLETAEVELARAFWSRF